MALLCTEHVFILHSQGRLDDTRGLAVHLFSLHSHRGLDEIFGLAVHLFSLRSQCRLDDTRGLAVHGYVSIRVIGLTGLREVLALHHADACTDLHDRLASANSHGEEFKAGPLRLRLIKLDGLLAP